MHILYLHYIHLPTSTNHCDSEVNTVVPHLSAQQWASSHSKACGQVTSEIEWISEILQMSLVL